MFFYLVSKRTLGIPLKSSSSGYNSNTRAPDLKNIHLYLYGIDPFISDSNVCVWSIHQAQCELFSVHVCVSLSMATIAEHSTKSKTPYIITYICVAGCIEIDHSPELLRRFIMKMVFSGCGAESKTPKANQPTTTELSTIKRQRGKENEAKRMKEKQST